MQKEISKEVIDKNYNQILEDIKRYSPYPEKVKILFVSKYYDIEEHRKIIEMGYNYFGENRAQVYRDKLKEFSGEKYKNIVWDFIGRLQKNKIKYIINNVNLIHSIDSYELLEDINKKAIENGRTVNGLIQINVSKEESKTGIYVEDFEKDSEKYFSMDNVKIIGFMTMAPLGASEEEISKYFSKMLDLKRKYAEKYGATIIRIGSKLISK